MNKEQINKDIDQLVEVNKKRLQTQREYHKLIASSPSYARPRGDKMYKLSRELDLLRIEANNIKKKFTEDHIEAKLQMAAKLDREIKDAEVLLQETQDHINELKNKLNPLLTITT